MTLRDTRVWPSVVPLILETHCLCQLHTLSDTGVKGTESIAVDFVLMELFTSFLFFSIIEYFRLGLMVGWMDGLSDCLVWLVE